jgi:hypothetical protein
MAPLGFWNHWIRPGAIMSGTAAYLTCFKMLLDAALPSQTRLGGVTVLHQVVASSNQQRPRNASPSPRSCSKPALGLTYATRCWRAPLGGPAVGGIELVRLFLERSADPVEADANHEAADRVGGQEGR